MRKFFVPVWIVLFAFIGSAQAEGQAPFDLSQMTLVVPAEEGLSGEDIDDSIKSLAASEGIFYVFYAPLYKQIEAVTGKPFRHLSLHMVCDAATAAKMVDYNPLLATMMPCRIAVVADKDNGKISLYTTNPDIFTSDPNMPADLRPVAEKVANQLKTIINGAAAGEF
jgi:uncharacterized protein (DUF302 family)